MTFVRTCAAALWLWVHNYLYPPTALASESVSLSSAYLHYTVWDAVEEEREQELYLSGTKAFWLRPDRNEYDVPCWMIEGEWKPPVQPAHTFHTMNIVSPKTITITKAQDLSSCVHGMHFYDEDAIDPSGRRTCLRCGVVMVTIGT